MKRRIGLLTLVLVVLFMSSLMRFAAETAVLAENQAVIVRAYFEDREQVWDLASWREPWQVDYEAGFVVLDATGVDIAELERRGFRVEVDEVETAVYTQPRVQPESLTAGIPGYSCYRTVEETYAAAEALAAANPSLATWIDIGDSWEKTEGLGGYDLMVLKLTSAAISEPKPKLFIMSSMHAREYAPAELTTRFAEQLVAGYGVNADITWLLDYHEIHLLLHANPDGRKQAETGIYWRKNANQDYCGTTSYSRGADLNRNFEFGWGLYGGSSGDECSEIFRGSTAGSEPETKAVQNYVRTILPDQRVDDLTAAAPVTATGVFLDVHSYGNLVLWPWGGTDTVAPNGAALQTMGRKLAYFNEYTPEQSVDLYPTDGTTGDFAYGELGLAAYTFEVGTSFFQDCAAFENQIMPDNLEALLYVAKVARTPYLTPSGPDVVDVAASSSIVGRGYPVTITAVISDARYQSGETGGEPTQPIAAVRVTVDHPPWQEGVAIMGTAVDGQFDETEEAVTAVVNTYNLTSDRHMLFVQGQDTNGNWGAVSSVFLEVEESAFEPRIYFPVIRKE